MLDLFFTLQRAPVLGSLAALGLVVVSSASPVAQAALPPSTYVPIQTCENDACEAGKLYPCQTTRAYYWANTGDIATGFPHKVDIRAACVVAREHVFFTPPQARRAVTRRREVQPPLAIGRHRRRQSKARPLIDSGRRTAGPSRAPTRSARNRSPTPPRAVA